MQYEAVRAGFWHTGAFWVLVAVVLFLLVFGGRILRAITGGLDRRAAAIGHSLEEAERLRREAEAMLQDAERRQAEAIETAHRLVAEATTRAGRLATELAREAAEANRRREQVVFERIAAAQDAAVKEVRAAATDLAVGAVARLLREDWGAAEDAAAIDGAIAKIPTQLRAA